MGLFFEPGAVKIVLVFTHIPAITIWFKPVKKTVSDLNWFSNHIDQQAPGKHFLIGYS